MGSSGTQRRSRRKPESFVKQNSDGLTYDELRDAVASFRKELFRLDEFNREVVQSMKFGRMTIKGGRYVHRVKPGAKPAKSTS